MLLIFTLALAEVKFVTGMGSAIKAGSHVPFKLLLKPTLLFCKKPHVKRHNSLLITKLREKKERKSSVLIFASVIVTLVELHHGERKGKIHIFVAVWKFLEHLGTWIQVLKAEALQFGRDPMLFQSRSVIGERSNR